MAIAQSGFVVPYDQPPAQAFEMYIDKVNEAGGVLGRQIKLVYSDTRSDLKAGKTAAQDVLSQGAEFLVVTCDYDYGGAAAREADDKGIISQSLCASAPQFGVQGIGPYAFTPSWGAPTQGGVAGEWAVSKGWKKAFVLCDSSLASTKAACDYFTDAFKHNGGTIAGSAEFAN
ncbi:MAG: ABC transporter substrate-binding protein, partial [Actinobacteria bacterium]|nr:ABC transporter substrate-binding protein [Actinomycetota bacterium]